MTELLLDTQLSTEQRNNLGIVRSSAESLLQVINDILDFSKIEAGKLHLDPIEFDIRSCINEALQPLTLRALQRRVELKSHVTDAVPTQLIGDPLRIRQIIINLASNAIKFTERGEVSVELCADREGDDSLTLHCLVRDTGTGIAREKLSTIFEAFSQADNSITRTHGGTGLGLTICSQLVKLMGGRIWVESELGRGSIFHFTAVLQIAPTNNFESPAKPTSDAAPRVALKPMRILVAEDNAVNQMLAR
jgi:two-component system, sensor histidine kinase and response regulator